VSLNVRSYLLDVREDFVHEELVFQSGVKMQLDVFLPRELLAFEYQGEQHFYDVFSMGSKWNYEQRDVEKREACKMNGITLIEIPYWWDKKRESLEATIHSKRPDLVNVSCIAQLIPTLPPKFSQKGSILALVNNF
jgi:hypothetical protein